MDQVAERSRMRVRILRQSDDSSSTDVAERTASERLAMMWQLARDAWTFKGDPEHAESRLQRHAVRVRRRGG